MSDTASTSRRRQSGRSPSYPAISLDRAVERARSLYKLEKRFAVPVETIMHHWGYSSQNGPGGLSLAAMKKFGLISDEGAKDDRRARLTDLAVRILEHPNETERSAAIEEAALTPPINREMWEEYGSDLPSDRTLVWTLQNEKGFTESGAREFARVYRDTISFAGLVALRHSDAPDSEGPLLNIDSADVPSTSSHEPSRARQGQVHPFIEQLVSSSGQDITRLAEANLRSIPIPLPGGGAITLQGAFPIQDDHWTYLLAVLNAMKPGLVAENKDD